MKCMRYSVVFVFTFAQVFAVPIIQENDESTKEVHYTQGEIVRSTPNFIMKCSISTHDILSFLSCTAEETLSIIRKVAEVRSLELIPGLVIVRENEVASEARNTETTQLPKDPNKKLLKLMQMIYDETSEFISGRTITLQPPETPSGLSENEISEESRSIKKKKKKQIFDLLLKILAVKLMTYTPAIAVVGGIAIKALLAAKLAFILATVLGVQSLFGNSKGGLASLFKGGLGGSSNQGWNSNSGGGGWSSPGGDGYGGWERSLSSHIEKTDEHFYAHDLAYAQQR